MSTDKLVDKVIKMIQPADMPAVAHKEIDPAKRAAVLDVIWTYCDNSNGLPSNLMVNLMRNDGIANFGPGTLKMVLDSLVVDGLIAEVGHRRYHLTQAGFDWLGQQDGVDGHRM